jgi:predicted aldo/keto reductase-like oxidoreductase
MQYRQFGKLGYEVSALGMGCMRFPRIYDGKGNAEVDREKAYELVRYAASHGVNYFDSAYGYHNMTSEEVLGEALEGGMRYRVKIATKLPFLFMKTQSDIRRNLENTLKKLRTSYLDLYLIHMISPGNWDQIKERGIFEEYRKLQSEGMIRAVGFSYHGGFDTFRDVMEYYDWDMCQVQQNMLDVDHEVTEQSIKLAGEKGTALVIMEPLRGGGLTNAPPTVQEIYDTWLDKRPPVEWAFRHLINYPQVGTVISGMTTMEQLKQNIEIFSKPEAIPGCLSDKEKDILTKAKAAYESIIAIPCTECEYCLPCPSGVGIPSVFKGYNEGVMFDCFDQPKRGYMFLGRGGMDASKCTECGTCEPKCPQNIKIVEQLKMSHESLAGWIE